MTERAGGELQVRRFRDVNRSWEVVKDRKEALTFQVDKPWLLTAFGVAGTMEVGEYAKLNAVYLLAGDSLNSKVIYSSASFQTLYTRAGQEPVHKVTLDPPAELFPHMPYTLLLTLQPGKFFQGAIASSQVRVDSTSSCVFLPTNVSQEAGANSGHLEGPIIDLYFCATQCSLQQLKEQVYKVLSDKTESQGREIHLARYGGIGSGWRINTDGQQVEAITFKANSSVQLAAVGIGNAFAEGTQVRVKTLELRKGPGTRGDMLYQHSQALVLQRASSMDQFVKVILTRPVPLLPAEFYTLRVVYEENAQVVRGTGVNNSPSAEGLTVTFTRAQFDGGDVENGSHETHGPLRDFYFLLA